MQVLFPIRGLRNLTLSQLSASIECRQGAHLFEDLADDLLGLRLVDLQRVEIVFAKIGNRPAHPRNEIRRALPMREPCIFRAQTARSSGHLRKLLCQFEIDLLSHACRVEPRGGDVHCLGAFNERRDAVIGRQSDPNIFEAHLLLKESKKVSELTIERQSHRCHFGTARPHTMSEQVVRREADAEKIGSRSIT